MSIGIKSDIRKLQDELRRTRRNQVPFATRLTLNQIARNIKADVDKQIISRVDRPTRFTQRAMRTRNATRSNMSSRVFVNDTRGEEKTLGHLFEGGGRRGKGMEGALASSGVLPKGKYMVPGDAAPKDSFGNVRRSFVRKLISAMQSFTPRNGNESTLSPGIWIRKFDRRQKKSRKALGKSGSFEFIVVHKQIEATGTRTKSDARPPELIFAFVDRPRYRRLFDLEDTARRTILRDFDIEFEKAFRRAVATAK